MRRKLKLLFDLIKMKITQYYFFKETGLEIDFIIVDKGYVTLLEVKAKTDNIKLSKTVMSHPEHYSKTKLI